MLKKLKIGLILLILIELACLKPNIIQNSNIYSCLFNFSANVKGKSIHSLRLYVNTNLKDKFTANLLLPTNKLIANVFFNGERLVIVDYSNRIAYIDSKEPFILTRILGMNIDARVFIEFFNKCYLKRGCLKKEIGGVKLIVNNRKEIIVLSSMGNVLLKPIGNVKTGGIKEFNFKIPKGYRVIYE